MHASSNGAPDLIQSLGSTWEQLAQSDPLWAVLSAPDKKERKWDLEFFLKTGEEEIATLMSKLRYHGISFDPENALDFGCGIGRLTQALAPHFREISGVDIAPTMIKLATATSRFPDKCHYVINSRADLSIFADNTFTFVFSSIVLQHVPLPLIRSYLTEFVRILRPGGLMIFQLPCRFVQEEVLPDTAFHARIVCVEDRLQVEAGLPFELTVSVENASPVAWEYNEPFAVRLGNHWLRDDGSMLLQDDGRVHLPVGLAASGHVKLSLTATAPREAGKYKLELDIVQEGVTWFHDKGSATTCVDVTVVAPPREAHNERKQMDEESVDEETRETSPKHFEMNCIPRADIVELLDRNGCKIEYIEPSGVGGRGTLSYYYFARKRERP